MHSPKAGIGLLKEKDQMLALWETRNVAIYKRERDVEEWLRNRSYDDPFIHS